MPSSPQTPPTLASWTQVNGGGNGTFSDVHNGVLINTVSGSNLKELYVAAPGSAGSAFTITAHISAQNNFGTQQPGWGICVGDTGTKTATWEINVTSSGTQGYRNLLWNSSTSFSSANFQLTNGFITVPYDVWLRVVYDGTGATNTLSFQYSPTGTDAASFLTAGTLLVSSFLATSPAKIGFCANSQNTGTPVIAILNYWLVTQP